MKNKLKYVLNFIKVLIWPIIFMIGSFIIRYIFVAIFNSKEKGSMNESEFLKYISTVNYQEKLNGYINSKTLLIVIITFIILFPILYKVYKKYIKKSNYSIKDIYIPLLFGISISLIYNISFYNFNNIVHFTNNFDGSTIPLYIQIITTGIIGPILEEILFRGIVYNKLKEFNPTMRSIILTSIIFGLIHFNLLNSIYAFGVSFMFIYLYEKYKTLKAPITMHMALNITTILTLDIIKLNYMIFNIYLVIVSIIILLFLKQKINQR